MKRHILTVHPTIYKCDYCDYESEKKDDLYAHQVCCMSLGWIGLLSESFINFSTTITVFIWLI